MDSERTNTEEVEMGQLLVHYLLMMMIAFI